MKRIFAITLAACLMGVMLLPSTASAKTSKVDVCHATGNGSYVMITISDKAARKHVKHGDGAPGDAVPGMDGYKFGNDCQPTECSYDELAGCSREHENET